MAAATGAADAPYRQRRGGGIDTVAGGGAGATAAAAAAVPRRLGRVGRCRAESSWRGRTKPCWSHLPVNASESCTHVLSPSSGTAHHAAIHSSTDTLPASPGWLLYWRSPRIDQSQEVYSAAWPAAHAALAHSGEPCTTCPSVGKLSTHPLLFSTFINSILYCFSVSYTFCFCWQSRQKWHEVIVPYIVWEGPVALREKLSGKFAARKSERLSLGPCSEK